MQDEITTILFDLDDTLLGNSMSNFMPSYFALLSEYAAPRFPDRQLFLSLLLRGTQQTILSQDASQTNREIFWTYFRERTGEDPAELEPFFDRFYEEQFPALERVTQQRAEAAPLVRACIEHGWQVVIATNPLFPLQAIEHRLSWAGLPVTEFDFALVTSYEIMHATKPNVSYYREILDFVEAAPEATLMVGDDWENDIRPAAQLGIRTYWISKNGLVPPDPELLDGWGTLANLWHILFPHRSQN